MKFISLAFILFVFSSCSSSKNINEATSKYTNSPTMGDAARAGGEKPF